MKTLALALDSINQDVPPSRCAPNEWSSGLNVRFVAGVGGQVRGETAVYPGIAEPAIFVLPFETGGIARAMAACDGSLWGFSGSSWSDLNAPGYVAGVAKGSVSGCVLNGIPVLSTGRGVPYYWTGAGNAQALTAGSDWGADWSAETMVAMRYHLVACGMTEGAVEKAALVRWSTYAAPGTLPANWIPAPENQAGSFELAQTNGPIIAAATLRDTLLIYKRRSAYAMQYVGGNEVMAQRLAFGDLGALSKNAVIEFAGRHLVVTEGDVIVHDGANVSSVVNRRMRSALFTRMDNGNSDSVFVVRDFDRSEILIAYPVTGSLGYCVEALVWNFRDDKIGVRALAPCNHGFASRFVELEQAIWEGDVQPWGQDATRWSQRYTTGTGNGVTIARGNMAQFLALDSGTMIADVPIVGRLERASIPLAGRGRALVRSVRPRINGAKGGVLNVRVGVQDAVSDPISWEAAQAFIIGTTEAVDVMQSGRFVSVALEATGLNGWSIEGLDIDYKDAGRV